MSPERLSRISPRSLLYPIALPLVLLLFAGCLDDGLDIASTTLATQAQPIVNGTADPQVVDLSEGQKLAIGWLHWRHSAVDDFCTGTVIAPNVVITASHCTEDETASGIGFSVGPRPNAAVASFDVLEIIEHPSVDAAILLLAADATVAVSSLVPIAVNTEPVASGDLGRPMDAAGFGDTKGTNVDARWFARVYLDRVRSSTITVDGRGEQGICYGDSGGPVLWQADAGGVVVVGVESYGDDTCVDEDVLTRLDVIYDDFIAELVEVESPDPCLGLDYFGQCSGNIAEWCDDGELASRDCAAEGRVCGWVDDETGHYCLDPGVVTEPEHQPTDVPSTDEPAPTGEPVPTEGPAPTEEPGSVGPTDAGEPSDELGSETGGSETPVPRSSEPFTTDGAPAGAQALGCAQAGGGAPDPLWLLVLVGLVAARLRR